MAAVLMLLLAHAVVSAQDCAFRITGTVTDDHFHPVTGAVVFLKFDASRGAATDTGGHFTITGICPGHVELVCRAMGFTAVSLHADINGNTPVQIILSAGANQLAQVFIKGRRVTDLRTVSSTELRGLEKFRTAGSSLGEALKSLPGLNAINNGPTISKPVIHGLHSNRVLILNNGVRQEGQQWGSEHAPEIDPFVANEISVVKGAASVRYGADAVGGVVLLNPDPLQEYKGISGNVYLIGQSNGRMGTVSGTLQGRTDSNGLQWRVQGTAKRAGNFRTPGYYLKNTGMEETDFSAQLGYHRKGFSLGAFYSYFHTRNGIFEGSHAGNITDLTAAISRSRPLTESVFSYHIGRSYQTVNHGLAKLSGSYQFANESKIEVTAARQGDLREEYDISLPYTNDPTLLSKPQVSFKLITHSAEVVYHTGTHRRFSTDVGISGNTQGNVFRGIRYLIPNFRTYSGGAFAVERYEKDRLLLEAGLRYDYRWQRVYQRDTRTLDVYNTTLTFANPSGTVGASWHFTDKLQVSGNIGTAWRAPSVNELYIHGVHFSDATYQDGDSTLRAERALNASLTVKYDARKLRGTIDVYRNHIGNYIYETPQAQPVTLLSGTFPAFRFTQDNVVISGLDGALQYDLFSSVTLQSRVTLVRGYNKTADDWLIYMPADRYEHGVVFNLHQWHFMDEPYISVENVTVLHQSRAPQGLDYAAPPPGYSLFNAGVGFRSDIGKKQVRFDFTVANITDKPYRDYLDRFRYYADNIGINFIIKTKLSF